MAEKDHVYSINPQCEAEITTKPMIHEKVGRATMVCKTIFCAGKMYGTADAAGTNKREAELSAEVALRGVVEQSCPKWQALINGGEAPNIKLPYEYMPPFK